MSVDGSDFELPVLREMKAQNARLLERALLVLSGLRAEHDLQAYQGKIDEIFRRFWQKYGGLESMEQPSPPGYLHEEIARALFDYLWNSKPKRFGESFLVTDAVDAQLDPDTHRAVGNCVGLTSLYSVLGIRAGLSLLLLVSPDHLLSRLRVGDRTLDIDLTDPQGFDCRRSTSFHEFHLCMLAASVLNSRGLAKERGGSRLVGKSDYEKALWVNPDYANAYNNRGNMLFVEGDLEGAVADYTQAIRLEPGFIEAFCNRGMARQRLGRFEAARADYQMALSLNGDYSEAREWLRALDGPGGGQCR